MAGHVGGEDRHGVAALDAGLGERMRQLPRARVELAIGEAPLAMDDRDALAEEVRRARQKAHRAQRHEVGRALAQLGSVLFMWNACLTAVTRCRTGTRRTCNFNPSPAGARRRP